MPVSEGDLIVGLAARGDGIGESGRFHPLTAPGDRILPDGRVEPGPHRAVPPCRHFPECGGCQLQHVDDPAYAAFLRDRIASALAAQGVAVPAILPAHISPPNSRRRATLKAEKKFGRIAIGFHAGKSHKIVDMRECHILRPELFALVEPMRRLLYQLLAVKDFAEIQMTLADRGPDVTITGFKRHGLAAEELLADFGLANGLARLSVDSGVGPETRLEPEPVTVTLGGVRVPLPHGAFLQATAEGEWALVEAVRRALGGARIVADLFAGLGTFALSIEGRVLAVEGARDAALALKAAAARAQRPVFVDHRDLYRRPLDLAELGRFEAVVLDPPRAGAKEQSALLAGSAVPLIAYVSCNPSTFARDAAALTAGGYRFDWVQPVGQFRWST
ncbi:MAG TPA: class I SAM-dependent RNA methyltransferase, partial [Allosphingosinicella sp.]|nr:class I SAM-dependent RNA methyltransferase [Allosphingosinicella sp.]